MRELEWMFEQLLRLYGGEYGNKWPKWPDGHHYVPMLAQRVYKWVRAPYMGDSENFSYGAFKYTYFSSAVEKNT